MAAISLQRESTTSHSTLASAESTQIALTAPEIA